MRALAALVAVALLGACSMSEILPESKKIDYKSAGKQNLPPLEIPPDLTAPGRDNRYAVPSSAPTQATLSVYQAERAAAKNAPANATVLPTAEKVRMERSGDQRWLVVPESPDKIWQTVKEFWLESGFIINLEQPDVGVMETDWAENRAKIQQDFIRNALGKIIDSAYDSGERDKFRTRLERSSDGGTEIYISHRGMEEVLKSTKDSTYWQPRKQDPLLEAEFLRRLMVRFGVDEQRSKTMAAGTAKPAERAKMLKATDGIGSLEIDEPFDRAWRRVGLALDRVGFTVEDRDRSKGYYFVRYVDPESDSNTKKESGGLLSKLAFWRSSEPKKNENEQYRVLVKDSSDVSQVQVLSKDGSAAKSDTARKILSLLFDQLK